MNFMNEEHLVIICLSFNAPINPMQIKYSHLKVNHVLISSFKLLPLHLVCIWMIQLTLPLTIGTWFIDYPYTNYFTKRLVSPLHFFSSEKPQIQSHQIFHVMVVAAAFVHYHGLNVMAVYREEMGECIVDIEEEVIPYTSAAA